MLRDHPDRDAPTRRIPARCCNKDLAEALIAAGRMLPAGMREIEKAKEGGRWEAAYTSPCNSVVADDFRAAPTP